MTLGSWLREGPEGRGQPTRAVVLSVETRSLGLRSFVSGRGVGSGRRREVGGEVGLRWRDRNEGTPE